MRDAYCRTVGIEYTHIQSVEEKRWIQEQVEGASTKLSADDQAHILDRLNAAEALEKFLATKWVGQKRFGIEGAESTIPDPRRHPLGGRRSEDGGRRARDGAPRTTQRVGEHRRQAVLAALPGVRGIRRPPVDPGLGRRQVPLGRNRIVREPRREHAASIELAANPSHLEAVNPVVEGITRAKMDRIPEGTAEVPFPVLPVLLHGDAAFAGQGVVAETLNLSLIRGYRVGGTVHLVINNQLGFTTAPHAARSSEYPTDIAKIVQAPIFHVNGDDPEACVRVARLAFAYRQRFHKDVVVDMVCYRRHGHNEGDDPSYTQPLMYRAIDDRRSVRKLYTEALVRRGDITIETAEQALEDFNSKLQEALEQTRDTAPEEEAVAKPHPPARGVLPHVETGVEQTRLDEIYAAIATAPDGFTIHPKLARQFRQRTTMFESGQVDWALAEAFAFGSLLQEGTSIRLAGQDTARGTFSQRHSVLVDHETGEEHLSLEQLCADDTYLWIYDSLLSEYAALGFEYGYSVASPETLVIWEAQFGDFMNGAQIIIDQFIVAAEDKWGQESGLVMLLPHGFEGQGPEHSSGRIERFLLLAAEDNIQICNATSAAQYFHLLRRQMKREIRKPLIVFTPKSGLRSKGYRSAVEALQRGSFQELLPDPKAARPEEVTRLVLASGKVGVDALAHRTQLDGSGDAVAVARVEQLFPWPFESVAKELARYPNCNEIVWLQEEPENMGPWNGIKGRLYEAHGDQFQIRRVSRQDSGSPATGTQAIHQQEQRQLLEIAFGPA